jgi:hypothetical protein
MKTKAVTLFILVATLLGCSKDKSNLTLSQPSNNSCPVNTTCSYIYYDNADFSNTFSVQTGQYRVFAYNSINNQGCGATASLYFKTSLSSNDFEITAAQIVAGQALIYGTACACCDVIADTKTIGGDIKGKKTGTNIWLINATVIRGNSTGTQQDTLTVNQYFTMSTMNAVPL